MCPHSSTFLALVLCLARVLHAQTGTLPPPTIHAEPAAESPLGQCVTVVCRSPAAFDVFRLEKEGGALKPDVSKPTPHDTEARFSFTADKGTEGHYRCLYYRNRAWSDRSATLDLVVTETPGSVGSSPPRTCNSTGDTQTYGDDSNSLELPSSRGEEQRPQERVSPAVDLEKTPDLPSVDRLPEEDREAPSPTPAAGSPQDVTYAQLDQQVLTQRTARATFPQSVEPTAEASTYASLARR
ncbi:leukocyte-associated immunoglobulin-like receptor 1 isoform X2 [Hyaena hyaena]|uniref:leukocyte-associated immunoglobulin-like receptor 1 isoform X2 n=1 Tax=Hyaena hyaena TaxID=95912 RepID=UPI001921E655|nr:leukocyte-associated immunoglobulin-like receptor 1 isoform X2 [Hyaena hyaena]